MAGKQPQREKEIPMIVRAVPLNGHRLNIEFSSGSFLDLHMASRLRTTRYYGLGDPAVFCAAVTDGSKIIFDPSSIFVPDIFPREAVNMALRAPGGDLSFLQVQPMENSRIQLKLTTGSVLVLNMENHRNSSRYSVLKDEEVFRSVRGDGESLIFGETPQDGPPQGDVSRGGILRIDEDELTYLMLSIPGP